MAQSHDYAAEAAARVTRRRRGVVGVTTTKPMEQMLWDAASSIRGAKEASKFKEYLLPLLFLKRLSDVFDDEIERLAEEYGDRATALEIAEGDHELLRFYVPPAARWGVISVRLVPHSRQARSREGRSRVRRALLRLRNRHLDCRGSGHSGCRRQAQPQYRND